MDRDSTRPATVGEIVGAIAWMIVVFEIDSIVVAGLIRFLS